LENYEDLVEISKELQPLQHINAQLEDKSTFFLIRAPTKDNVHRAIKYGVWTRLVNIIKYLVQVETISN